MMKAVVIESYGSADGLVVQQRPLPTPGPGEVLIKVHAAGINRPDIFQRRGQYPAPRGVVADVPGLEVAGVIAACGVGVTRWIIGDRVCALVAGGGYAEYVVVDASHCLPIPSNLSFIEAASLPEAMFTVWHNVFQRGNLQRGEKFLVHGGSGGIGSTAIQLSTLFGAQVYATAGSAEKCSFCETLGAISCINYKEVDFCNALKDLHIDVILDSIGGPYFDKHISLLADEGRLIAINAIEGRRATIDLLKLMQRRLTITGSTLRSRDSDFKAALRESVERNVWPFVATGAFKPVIYRVFSLFEAAQAHELMESGRFMGKLVLTV